MPRLTKQEQQEIIGFQEADKPLPDYAIHLIPHIVCASCTTSVRQIQHLYITCSACT